MAESPGLVITDEMVSVWDQSTQSVSNEQLAKENETQMDQNATYFAFLMGV